MPHLELRSAAVRKVGKMEQEFECDHNCDMCWPTIGRKHILVGVLLWLMAVCFIYFFLLKEIKLLSFIVAILVCFLCRAYFCSANLTTFYFSGIPLLWGRLVLTAIFTVIPALDVQFFFAGPNKAIVHEFFIDVPPKIAEDVADNLRNRYLIQVLGEKELLIYANSTMKVVFFENKICIERDPENEKTITYCFFDTSKDIAARIAAFIENDK